MLRVIGRKFKIGTREVIERYGKDISLNIRKKDGTEVILDFKCPILVKTPLKFLGTKEFKDPLAEVG